MPVQDLKPEPPEPLLWNCRGNMHSHHRTQPSKLRVPVCAVSDKISVDTADKTYQGQKVLSVSLGPTTHIFHSRLYGNIFPLQI